MHPATKSAAALLATIAALVAGMDALAKLYLALLIFVLLDWLTAMMACHHTKEALESSKLARTGEKVVGHSIGVGVLWLISALLFSTANPNTSGFAQALIPSAYLGYALLKEAWSIFENLDRCGVKLPPFIKKRLKTAIHDFGEDKHP